MMDEKRNDAAQPAGDTQPPQPNDAQRSDAAQRADAVDREMQEQGSPSDGTPDERIAAIEAELEEANRRLLMAQADVENFRKRMRRDYEEQLRYAAVPLVKDVLDVLDNLRRALDAASTNDAAAGLREGVAMVAKQLEDTIRKHHCRPIPAEGELFDPNYHEAISQMPSESHPAGTVAHEAVRGYQLHDRVVRPSQVVVSTGPPQQ